MIGKKFGLLGRVGGCVGRDWGRMIFGKNLEKRKVEWSRKLIDRNMLFWG